MKKNANRDERTSGWRIRLSRLRWPAVLAPYRRRILIGLGVLGWLVLGAVAYLYVSFCRIIDARLHGERDRAIPRVFARPLTLHTGQSLSQAELVADSTMSATRSGRGSSGPASSPSIAAASC